MSSVRETQDRINQINQVISNHLTRFTQQYIPSPEILKAILDYRRQLAESIKKANIIYEAASEPFNREHAIKTTELSQRRAQEQAEAQRQLSANPQILQQKLNDIQRNYQRAESDLREELLVKHLNIENQELNEIDNRLNQLVDQVLEIDRALKGQEAIQKTQQGLTNHRQIFQQASAYHSMTAWIIIVILSLILAGGGLGLYVFFIKSHKEADCMITHKDAPLAVLVMMLASGLTAKLAFLLIWGAVLKYLADLYKKNAMQAVLYKDRSMALDIVENLLTISPQLEQKKDLLRVLSDGYLDFEKSAFHLKSADNNKDEDVTIGKLKETIDVVKPLIDSFKGILDKEKIK